MSQAKDIHPGEKIEIGGHPYKILNIDTNAFGSPIFRLRSEDSEIPLDVTLILPPQTEVTMPFESWVTEDDILGGI